MEEVVVDRATEVLPKLRFPQYAGPWKKGPIGKHIEFVSGVALPGNEISEEKGGVAILRGINITEGSVRHSPDIDRYYHGSLDGIDHLLLKEGDLVLGMDGSKVGKNTAVISKEDEGSLLIQRVARIRPTGTASIDFIYHHIFSYRFHDYVDVVNTSSGIPHISGKQIREFEIAFPTLPEQQKIAAFLGAVDRKIQQLKCKQALLEQYKKGVVQQLFSQELRFKREDGGEYPEWEERDLQAVCSISKGEQLNRSRLTEVGQYPSYSGGVEPSGYSDAWNTTENTITISEGGNSCGFVNFIRSKFWCGGHCYALTQLRKDVDVSFLYQCLKYHEPALMRLRVGSGLPNVQKKDLAAYLIQLPSLEEQARIAGFLMALDAKVAGVARAVEAAQKWKRGLLQQMFV